jgi:hypothetical protein
MSVQVRACSVEPSGLGGWLLFFWVGMTFLSPLFSTSNAMKSGDPVDWCFAMAITGSGLTAGYFVYEEDPRALQWLRILLFIGAIHALFLFMKAWGSHSLSDAQANATDRYFFYGGKRAIGILIWWLYFKYSDRVRNTFGRNI